MACCLLHSIRVDLMAAILSLTVLKSPSFHVLHTNSFTSGLFFSLRSYRKRPRFFFFSGSKKEIRGLWSDPSYARYWHLAVGNSSAQSLLATARSRRHRTRSSSLWPRQDRKSPECGRSNRSPSEKNVRKSVKDPSGLVAPPSFSSLLSRSLKSPVKNQGASRVPFSSSKLFHRSLLRGLFVSP